MATQTMRTTIALRAGVAIVGLAVLGLIALLGYGLTTSDGRGEAQDEARPQGKPVPQFQMPLYQGAEFVPGDSFNMANLKGHPVVLNFWFPSCFPCRIGMPEKERAWRRYRDQGVVFVEVTSTVWDTERDILEFLEEFDITQPVGPDATGEIAIDFGVFKYPSTYFITADGTIARKKLGSMTAKELETFVEELLQ